MKYIHWKRREINNQIWNNHNCVKFTMSDSAETCSCILCKEKTRTFSFILTFVNMSCFNFPSSSAFVLPWIKKKSWVWLQQTSKLHTAFTRFTYHEPANKAISYTGHRKMWHSWLANGQVFSPESWQQTIFHNAVQLALWVSSDWNLFTYTLRPTAVVAPFLVADLAESPLVEGEGASLSLAFSASRSSLPLMSPRVNRALKAEGKT